MNILRKLYQFKLNKQKNLMCYSTNCQNYDFNTNCIEKKCSLINRSIVCIRNLTSEEIKSVIGTAQDLKNKSRSKVLQGRHIAILIEDSNIKHQLAAEIACGNLGAGYSVLYEPFLNKKYYENDMQDLGKMLSAQSSIIAASVHKHSTLLEMSKGASVPVVNMSTCFQTPLEALAILMTIYENFGKIQQLKIAILGNPSSLINSIMCLAPRVGISTNISCSVSKQLTSPRFLKLAESYEKVFKTITHQVPDHKEAIKGVNIVIAFWDHDYDIKIALNDLKNAAENWKIIHNLPNSINQEICEHENNLSIKTIENLNFIYSALFIRLIDLNSKQ